MNAQIHRTIYNQARGCLISVAETAKSSGKASGESRPSRTSKSKTPTCRKARSALSAGGMWLQANTDKGYSLPCLKSQSGNGAVNLQTLQTSNYQSTSKETSDVLWQAAKGSGSQNQNTNYNQINGKVAVTAQKINIEGVSPSLNQAVSDISNQAGMAWVGQLASDPALAGKVNWQKVDEAHKTWNYEQEGLSKTGAMLVSIAISVAVGGADGGGLGASISAAAGGGATGAAALAGFTALASTASVSMINNGGDLSKVLKELGSSQNVKGLLTSMVTAGALSSLGSTSFMKDVGGTTGASTLTSQLSRNLINSAAAAVVTSAINGTSLEDNLKAGFTNALISTGSAQANFAIGQGTEANSFANYMAHAIAGCVVGAAKTSGASGGSGCSAGAVGGVVGEAAALWATSGSPPNIAPNDTVAFAGMMSAIAVATAGGNPAQIAIAQAEGSSAALNNCMGGLIGGATPCGQVAKETLKKLYGSAPPAVSLEAAQKAQATAVSLAGGAGVLSAGEIDPAIASGLGGVEGRVARPVASATSTVVTTTTAMVNDPVSTAVGFVKGAANSLVLTPTQLATNGGQSLAIGDVIQSCAVLGCDVFDKIAENPLLMQKLEVELKASNTAQSGGMVMGEVLGPLVAAKGVTYVKELAGQLAQREAITALAGEANAANAELSKTQQIVVGDSYAAPKNTTTPTSTFQTHGLTIDQVPASIKAQLTKDLEATYGVGTGDKLQELIKSGNSVPVPIQATSETKLYKLVADAEARMPSSATPYFVDAAQLQRIQQNPELANQILGLPAGNQSQTGFRVYEMKPLPNVKPTVYQSNIATTSNYGGTTDVGNATQTLVPNRSLWTEPKLSNIQIKVGGN